MAGFDGIVEFVVVIANKPIDPKILSEFLGFVAVLTRCSGSNPTQRRRSAQLNTRNSSARPAVAAAMCRRDAVLSRCQPRLTPDLLEQLSAYAVEIAEKYQNGEITPIQMDSLFAQKKSEIMAEFHRRMLADRFVFAQENAAFAEQSLATATLNAAAAMNRPRTCTTFGNSVTCN
jgi:hypothetical protein